MIKKQFVLDPYVIALNDSGLKKEQWLSYLHRLRWWQQFTAQNAVQFVMTNDSFAALFADDCYPAIAKLKEVDARFYDAAEALPLDSIAVFIHSVAAGLIEASEMTIVRDFSAVDCTMFPPEYLDRLGQATRLSCQKLFSTLAIAAESQNNSPDCFIVVSAELDEKLCATVQLRECSVIWADGSATEHEFIKQSISLVQDGKSCSSFLENTASSGISSLMAVLDEAKQKYSNLVFDKSAFDSASQSPYKYPERVKNALVALSCVYEQVFDGTLDCDLITAFNRYDIDFAAKESTSALGNHPAEYQMMYNGSVVSIQPHLKLGYGYDVRVCLRIHFYVDIVEKKVIVAHVGRHKKS